MYTIQICTENLFNEATLMAFFTNFVNEFFPDGFHLFIQEAQKSFSSIILIL